MNGGSLLLIGHNDPSDRQGISRDYEAVRSVGVRAGVVVTSLVNGPPIQDSVVASQLAASMEFLKPACVRIGLVRSVDTVRIIAESLDRWKPESVVLDPMGIGDPDEVADDLIDSLRDLILPKTSLMTATWRESGALIRAFPRGLEDLNRINISLRRLGVGNLLLDTSELPGDSVLTVLFTGAETRQFEITRQVLSEVPRGLTSALIAARLTQGNSIDTACELVLTGQDHGARTAKTRNET